jgi:hypothetical protein
MATSPRKPSPTPSARAGHRAAATLALALLVPAPAPVAAMPSQEADAWREDLRFMAAQMEARHKNLYHSITREGFAAMVDSLDRAIPALERDQVIVRMAQIVAAVGDGHTNIYPTRDPKIGFHTLPVVFTFFGDSLYVRAVTRTERAILGARVVRLGDRDVAEAYAAVRSMIGRDNEQGARYWAQYLLAIPEVLHALGITRTADEVPLTLESGKGVTRVVLRPDGPVPIMSGDIATLYDRRDGWIDVRDLTGRPDPLWLRDTGGAFHFERAGDLLYVQINKVGDEPGETLEQFSRRLHDEIADTKPDKVAIDLRLNRGGDGTLNVFPVRALIQSEPIDRQGHLFVIIGPATFSAAQMLADAIEEYTYAEFVGEPTGSKGNAFGDSRKIILPRSGITVRASIFYWQDWHPLDTRDAIQPQIPAPLTFEDYRANVDPALRAIEHSGADDPPR